MLREKHARLISADMPFVFGEWMVNPIEKLLTNLNVIFVIGLFLSLIGTFLSFSRLALYVLSVLSPLSSLKPLYHVGHSLHSTRCIRILMQVSC